MSEKPLVSILLLSMNHELFIEQCIESVLSQSYNNIEILYLDNASKDDTFLKAQQILKTADVPHKIFRNQNSKGVSANFNFLIEQSKGDYLMPLSTDDWWFKDNVELKAGFLTENDDHDMVYSDGYFLYQNGSKKLFSDRDAFHSGKILNALLLYNFIKAPTVMFTKKIVNSIGGFDENLMIEDWDLWIRIAETSFIGFIDKPLVYYRYAHGGNLSSNQPFIIAAFRQMIEKYKLKYPMQMKTLTKKNIITEANIKAHTPLSSHDIIWYFKNFKFNMDYTKAFIRYITKYKA